MFWSDLKILPWWCSEMKSQRPNLIFNGYSSFSDVQLLLRVTEVSGREISPPVEWDNRPRPLYIIGLSNK